MKTVTHKLWPVSYIDNEGNQQDALYTFDPSRVDKSYWVGEPVLVAFQHTESMTDTHREAKIASLKKQIEDLEGKS